MISPLRLREKIGYGFGDAASSMYWKLFGMYLLFFYTDVFGISAAAVGTMFLVTRLGNAAFDPLVGILGDRTQTRWGKFRPYLLWMALPVAVCAVLTFTTPQFSPATKLLYAYVTFALMMVVYSLINVPYAALMGVMSDDGKERTALGTYRFIFAFGGSFLVLGLFQPLFDAFGSRTLATWEMAPVSTVQTYDGTSNGERLVLWDHTPASGQGAGGIDSLLYITARVATTSAESFRIGVADTQQHRFYSTVFPQGRDTLGLVRDGRESDVRLRLDVFVPKEELAHLDRLIPALSAVDPGSITTDRMEVREIDYRSGTRQAVLVISLLATLFFVLTFLLTREKVAPISVPTSLRQDLRDLRSNLPWFILVGASISTIFFNTIRDGAALYYFTYYATGPGTIVLSRSIVLAISTVYLLIGQAANIVGVVLAGPLSARIGKNRTFMLAMINAAIFSGLFYGIGKTSVVLMMLLQFIVSLHAGVIFPLIWAMFADTADYSEWKNRRRATGLVFSAASMSQKFGASIGIAMVGWLLSLYGYQPNVAQSELTQTGIRLMLSIFPGIGALLGAIFIYLYPLKEDVLARMSSDLSASRAKGDGEAK